MRWRLAIFDFDGTPADSFGLFLANVNTGALLALLTGAHADAAATACASGAR